MLDRHYSAGPVFASSLIALADLAACNLPLPPNSVYRKKWLSPPASLPKWIRTLETSPKLFAIFEVCQSVERRFVDASLGQATLRERESEPQGDGTHGR